MSKIAKKPIVVPSGVEVSCLNREVNVTGPKGALKLSLPEGIGANITEGNIKVTREENAADSLAGIIRTLIFNNIEGVSKGWQKTVELSGTGYRAAVAGGELNLALGFSHPVTVKPPAGISFDVKEGRITVSGADKAVVGEVLAKIRALKPADPYKLKGFKYENEVIIKKAGKAAKAGGTTGAAK